MHVLVVAAWPPWPMSDGARMVLRRQLELLSGRHRLTLLAAGRHPGRGDPEQEPPPIRDVETHVVPVPSGRLRAYAAARLGGLVRREPEEVGRVVTPGLIEALQDHLAREPDVVHLFGWATAALAPAVAGVPTVHTALDAWPLGVRMRAKPRWRDILEADQRWLAGRHERRYYPHCGAVIVVSELDAADIRRRVPEARVEVIPNGVEAGPDPVATPEPTTIGFHGSFAARANVDAARVLVREVLPLVREEVPDAKVLLVGHDPNGDARVLAGDGVEVTGTVTAVRPMLERMAVYVAPMVSGTGLKNKVLEAMAAGLPVIAPAHALGGIGTGDGVVVAETPGALAAAAVRLLHDPVKRQAIGAEARERAVRDFSWERSAERVEALWRELAG